jgi:hypothetical protein
MKNIIVIILLFYLESISALNIHQITVAQTSDHALKVNLFTEADELYYFQNWQYTVSDSEITIQVLFVPGFGSKIALLNNQFELNFNQTLNDSYKFTVKVYYQVFDENQLQDSVSSFLFFPLLTSITLNNSDVLTASGLPYDFRFFKDKITIFDISNKVIVKGFNVSIDSALKGLPTGFYLILFENEKTTEIRKIIIAN